MSQARKDASSQPRLGCPALCVDREEQVALAGFDMHQTAQHSTLSRSYMMHRGGGGLRFATPCLLDAATVLYSTGQYRLLRQSRIYASLTA